MRVQREWGACLMAHRLPVLTVCDDFAPLSCRDLCRDQADAAENARRRLLTEYLLTVTLVKR